MSALTLSAITKSSLFAHIIYEVNIKTKPNEVKEYSDVNYPF